MKGSPNRVNASAGEIEKIVHELDRPSDQSQRVDERARPEEQDDEEPGADIRPSAGLAAGEDQPRVIDQEVERDALNDAAKRQLDLDDHRVEFSSAATRRSHDASRNPSAGRMSTVARGAKPNAPTERRGSGAEITARGRRLFLSRRGLADNAGKSACDS
jgi:hypothetical protein